MRDSYVLFFSDLYFEDSIFVYYVCCCFLKFRCAIFSRLKNNWASRLFQINIQIILPACSMYNLIIFCWWLNVCVIGINYFFRSFFATDLFRILIKSVKNINRSILIIFLLITELRNTHLFTFSQNVLQFLLIRTYSKPYYMISRMLNREVSGVLVAILTSNVCMPLRPLRYWFALIQIFTMLL